MKAPERIYLHRDRLGAVTWETEPDNNAIEYVRRDVAQKLREMVGDLCEEVDDLRRYKHNPEYSSCRKQGRKMLDETAWLAEPTPEEVKP